MPFWAQRTLRRCKPAVAVDRMGGRSQREPCRPGLNSARPAHCPGLRLLLAFIGLRFGWLTQCGIATSVIELRVLPARTPNVSFGDLPDIVAPALQPRVRVTIDSAYPTSLRGRLQLRFTPDPGLNVDDPSIRFVDGSRAVDFEIPADSTEAVFAVPQFALQTGSVAGIINLDVSLTAGDFDVTPLPAPAKSLRVDRTAPVISSARLNATAGGFEVIVSGFSTTREVTGATFQFTPASGSRLDASQITIQTNAAARQWFGDARSSEFGGQFTCHAAIHCAECNVK